MSKAFSYPTEQTTSEPLTCRYLNKLTFYYEGGRREQQVRGGDGERRWQPPDPTSGDPSLPSPEEHTAVSHPVLPGLLGTEAPPSPVTKRGRDTKAQPLGPNTGQLRSPALSPGPPSQGVPAFTGSAPPTRLLCARPHPPFHPSTCVCSTRQVKNAKRELRATPGPARPRPRYRGACGERGEPDMPRRGSTNLPKLARH